MAHDYANADDLLERIAFLGDRTVYLIGSAVTAPSIPDAEGVIELVREALARPRDRERLNQALELQPENRYEATFRHLLNVRGQDFANDMIRRAVLAARRPTERFPRLPTAVDERVGSDLEDDADGWQLTPGIAALGEILARTSGVRRPTVISPNFDPLVKVAIRLAGGAAVSVAFDGDGGLENLGTTGCLVGQIHGDWCRGDTLHARGQLKRDRPVLAASLARLLGERTLVVIGHDGRADILTRALIDQVRGSQAPIDVVWTFAEEDGAVIAARYPTLLEALAPGIEASSADPGLVGRFRRVG